ncbi:hypothetical protein QEN19_004122 [Hanseniaspora menglaensis]
MANNQKNPSEKELELGITRLKDSWHYDFKDHLYVFITGIDEKLTELDVLKVFSQYGNIVDLFFIYDYKKKIKKSSCVLQYDTFESCVLAVDNLNNYKLLDRWIKVSHTKCKYPDHQDFKKYHDHIMTKLDEAIVYEGDERETQSIEVSKTSILRSKSKESEMIDDPMYLISDQLLEIK